MSDLETKGYIQRGLIQTWSGRAFDVCAPSTTIDINDIATALSKQCRFSGHNLRFLSVAEHCVNVAKFAPDELKLTALMHDASEAYLVDIPRPIKPLLKGYYELEDHLMTEIAHKFKFLWPLPTEIKSLDARHLFDEREQNMAPLIDQSNDIWGDPLPPLGVTLQYWTPDEARHQFLSAFIEYGGRP
jgi:hypothetical protein